MDIQEQKNKMIESLNLILNAEVFDLEKYNEEKLKYAKFCYDNGLDTFSPNLDEEQLKRSFVVDSTPLFHDIDDELKNKAVGKIINKEALEKIEADTILKSVVNIGRKKLSEDCDIENDNLSGTCGYGQALTYFPLNELGVETTINNINGLPDVKYRHAFLTCFLNVKENNETVKKQYLIDLTYRQFFTNLNCCEAKFYEGRDGFKNETAPDAGYFLTKFDEGIKFSTELLKNGFIELTEKNARLYGLGFSCESLNLSNISRKEEITSHSGEEYLDAINYPLLQDELDYDYDEIYELDELPILARSNLNQKKI